MTAMQAMQIEAPGTRCAWSRVRFPSPVTMRYV